MRFKIIKSLIICYFLILMGTCCATLHKDDARTLAHNLIHNFFSSSQDIDKQPYIQEIDTTILPQAAEHQEDTIVYNKKIVRDTTLTTIFYMLFAQCSEKAIAHSSHNITMCIEHKVTYELQTIMQNPLDGYRRFLGNSKNLDEKIEEITKACVELYAS